MRVLDQYRLYTLETEEGERGRERGKGEEQRKVEEKEGERERTRSSWKSKPRVERERILNMASRPADWTRPGLSMREGGIAGAETEKLYSE